MPIHFHIAYCRLGLYSCISYLRICFSFRDLWVVGIGCGPGRGGGSVVLSGSGGFDMCFCVFFGCCCGV